MKGKIYKGIAPFEKRFLFFGKITVLKQRKQTYCGTADYIYFDKEEKIWRKCEPNKETKRMSTRNSERQFFLVNEYDDYFDWEIKTIKMHILKEKDEAKLKGLKRREKVLKTFKGMIKSIEKRW